jgi:hypothetical protein
MSEDYVRPASECSLRALKTRTNKLDERLDKMERRVGFGRVGLQDFIENLKVVNKRGEMTSLILNRSQEIVFHKLLECREQRRPARFICCKARQIGISTLLEAFIFALITQNQNRFSLVVANSLESAAVIFSMTQRFVRQLGSGVDAAVNARRIEYAPPHNSRIQIDTAANRSLGRGGTLHYVHASELAFWERPEDPVLAINQSVPQHRDTLVFWESTANGVQNLFHRMWVAAERGESDLEPIFLPWTEFPEYSLPTHPSETLSLTVEEKRYADTFSMTDEQLKWACFTKKNQCHDSWEKFHQEYPAAAHLAFIFSGLPWFDQKIVLEMLDNPTLPVFRGYIARDDGPSLKNDPNGPLSIWRFPEPGETYSLGMDVGEGVGADYTVIQVIRNNTGEVAARYSSNRVLAEIAGIDAYNLGAYYNFGLLGIERNGPGLAALALCERGSPEHPHVRGYPNLYYHTFTDRKIPEETRRLGWITNRVTKEAMLNRLALTFRDRGLIIHCRRTLLEMQGFVWDADRKIFRQNYKTPGAKLTHDDEIIALAISNEMRHSSTDNRFAAISPGSGEF